MSDSAVKPTASLPTAIPATDGLLQDLQFLFNALPGAYLLLSPELIIEAVSNDYLAATLTQREGLIGRFLFDAFPDNPKAPEALAVHNLRSSLEQVLASGQPHQMARQRYDVPDPNNPGHFVERYALPRNSPVFDAQGHLRHIIHSVTNITESVTVEAKLQESQKREQRAQTETERQRQRLERLFMQAPAAICILDGPGLVFELVNPTFQQLFPGRTLLGKAVLEAIPEIVDQPIYTILQNVFQTGETFEGRELLIPLARHEHAPLEEIYFNFIYQARFNEQGKVDGILVFAFEVTDLVEARKASEASAQQVRLITDALPVLVGYLDKEEKYRFANRAYEEWFGQQPEDLLGQPVREVIGEKAYQGVKDYIDRALAGERLDFAARMPYRENFIKHIHTSYVPDIRAEKVIGFYTMVTDVTEQVEARKALEKSEQQAKALARELAAANEELQVANQHLIRTNVDLDNFIYTASHDLKAPILNIEGLMEALLDLLPPESLQSEPVQRTTSFILDSVQRFKRTIDHLTEITKLQKENNTEASPVNLAKVIAEVQLDLASAIKAARAQIEADVTLCPSIRFSEKNLRSIVYNLLSNAIKYHAPQRPLIVRVHCYETAEYQVLSVQDNGLGMDLTQEHKLFAMFQRLHDHVEGSGIGLYMVKKIIENAGGKIEVQSEVGSGSTFQVYFRKNP